MFKSFLFLWRRDGTSREEFLDYYETRHAPLAERILPPMADYRRNYPIWDPASESHLGGFSVMTEVWHDSEETFRRTTAARRTSPVKEQIDEDESNFMYRQHKFMAAIDDERVHSFVDKPTAAYKVIRFVEARIGADLPSFKLEYERVVVPQMIEFLEAPVEYRRSYAGPGEIAGVLYGRQEGSDRTFPTFDLVEELWTDTPVHDWPKPDMDGVRVTTVEVQERRLPRTSPHAPVASH